MPEYPNPLPEPEKTGVKPVQTDAPETCEVMPPDPSPGLLLSSAVEGNYIRGMGPTNVPLLAWGARQYEQRMGALDKEQNTLKAENSALRQQGSDDGQRIARLEERLKNGPAVAVSVSALQIIGGGIFGAGLGQIATVATPIGWTGLIIGLGMVISSFVVLAKANSKGDV